MSLSNTGKIKLAAVLVWVVIMVFASLTFWEHRHYKEKVVTAKDMTEKKTLGEYFKPIKGTINDCNLYFFEGEEPGATFLVLGGSHPEEPAANLTPQILAENLEVEKGRVIVAIHQNVSATTVSKPGEAFPPFYTIETDWGEKKFRMGSRWAHALDSWPDPIVYTHYPSKQRLASVDIRNMNRTWPGRKNGNLIEQTNHAFMQLIKEEGVDMTIDLHEAELEYSVINTIVAHENSANIAALVSMELTPTFEKAGIGVEKSPKELHGLSHREIGDHSDSGLLLFEVAEPMLDRIRGVTGEKLLLEGKDPFVRKAGQHGLLYSPMPESGWPIDVRVGRHSATILKTIEVWNQYHPNNPIQVSNIPGYQEVKENGVGYYFHNPEEVSEDRVAYE